MTEMPNAIRIPLHELQADVAYLFGRVAADGSVAGIMASAVTAKLGAIEAAILAVTKETVEKDDILDACLVYFDNKQDADYDSESGFIPNQEMVLASRIKEVIDAHPTLTDEATKARSSASLDELGASDGEMM